MKAEFELKIDEKTGMPVIAFRHHDKRDNLDQQLLKRFVNLAKEKGVKLANPSGHLESGTLNSWENYEIKINE